MHLFSTDHSISDWEVKRMHELKGRAVTASTSATSTSASTSATSPSATVVVKVERTRGPPQKQDYRGITEAEKKTAKKALVAERLARGKAEIKDLRVRFDQMSLADVKINIFKGNGFMWTIACSVLFRANMVLYNFPGLLARLPNEADPDKASNAWRQVDRDALNYALDMRGTSGEGLRLQYLPERTPHKKGAYL